MDHTNEVRRAFREDGAQKTHIGGQALLEGVMMRGKYNWAVGVRQSDGLLYSEAFMLSKKGHRPQWFSWPLVRGCVVLVDSLVLGFKALEIAANKAFDNEEIFEDDVTISKGEMAGALCLGIVLALALFMVLPAFVSNVLVGEYEQHPFVWNVVDGVVRVAIFIFYVWLIGRLEDIKRMFAYHGAEHKTIHCYEHGLALTPENAQQFPRLHVRCGTAFLIMVMLIAIVVYTLLPLDRVLAALGITGIGSLILLIVVRITFLPLIAGISYEITVKWAGSYPDSPVVKAVLWPGMQMQRLTTNEPDEGMLECAIAAMNLVLTCESNHLAQHQKQSA